MEEAEKHSEVSEIVPPQPEIRQEAPEQVEAAPKEQHEDRSDPHWLKNLRKERQELARKNRMLEDIVSHLSQGKAPVAQQAAPDEDFLSDIQKEEYVPGEKVAKGFKKLEEKFQRQLQEVEQKYKATAYQSQINELRREYPDLEEVVNPDTLQIVKEKNPRLASTWAGLDDYTLYVQAYPYIKHSGVLEDIPGFKRSKEVEKKLEQNKKTVPSPASFDKRPMAQAFDFNRLSDAQKKELNKEMMHYASMSGGAY